MSKFAKNIFLTSLFVALTFSLFACSYLHFVYRKPDKEVASVQLVYYDNSNARNNPLEWQPLNLDKLEILETLNTNEIESFVDKLSRIQGVHGGMYRQKLFSHDGIGVRITYEDGSFTVITLTLMDGDNNAFFIAEYDKDYNQVESRSVDATIVYTERMAREFHELINEHFTWRES
jgi:hypothetical protein